MYSNHQQRQRYQQQNCNRTHNSSNKNRVQAKIRLNNNTNENKVFVVNSISTSELPSSTQELARSHPLLKRKKTNNSQTLRRLELLTIFATFAVDIYHKFSKFGYIKEKQDQIFQTTSHIKHYVLSSSNYQFQSKDLICVS